MHGTTLMLAVTDEPTRERIESRLRQLIEELLDPTAVPVTLGALGLRPDPCAADCCPAPPRRPS